jgi:putative endonuclease
MAYFCYIVECSDGSYYTGWAKDPDLRTRQHNLGRGAVYTRLHRPVQLVYVEEVADVSCALRRERALKKLTHDQKQRLIDKFKER